MTEELFGATALAKRASEVVRRALRAPIAVMTPHGTVSMLNRDRWLATERRARLVEDLFRAINAAHAGSPAAAFPPALRWVRLIPKSELATLSDEVMSLLDAIDDGRASLDELEDTLHEWAETAIHVAAPQTGPILRNAAE